MDEIVHEKAEEKWKRSILCNLAIETRVNDIFDDLHNEGVEESVFLEDQIEKIADITVEAVVDNIIENTVGDFQEKQHAVRHLFTEASLSDIVTPPSTPANVLIQ